MNDTHNSSKNNKPDYYVKLKTIGPYGKERLWDFGGVWNAKNGYITGSTPLGDILIQPREEAERIQAEWKAKRHQE